MENRRCSVWRRPNSVRNTVDARIDEVAKEDWRYGTVSKTNVDGWTARRKNGKK